MSTGTLSTPRRHVLLRIAAAVLGGYAFCWGFVAGPERHGMDNKNYLLKTGVAPAWRQGDGT